MAGRAIAAELSSAGWDVVGTGRRADRFSTALAARGVRFVKADRYQARDLRRVLAPGTDVVVDCLCYTAEHARQLLAWRGSFGSAVVLSSKAVYVDGQGRHANSNEPPRFAGPVTEERLYASGSWAGAERGRSRPVDRDRRRARDRGCTPAGTYAQTVAATVEELLRLGPHERAALERDEYFAGRFDYRIDDAALDRQCAR